MTGGNKKGRRTRARGSRIRSQRDSFKRSTKIIQISSAKNAKNKEVVGERERGRESASNPITTTRDNNNELIMLQVKAKKEADEVEAEV